MHIFPNSKRYIGITSYGSKDRWHGGHGYKKQTMMWRAIQKYGWENIEHKILYTGLTQNEAEEIKKTLIAQYKSHERRYGYNIENGGLASGGYKLSEETSQKMSVSRRGENNHNYGKHLSQETREKMSKAHVGKCNIEAVRSGAKKRSGANAYNARKVVQCGGDGEIIAVFECVKQAEKETGTSSNDICACCKGRQKTAHGFKWKYFEEVTI